MAVEVNKTYLLGEFSIEVDRRALVRAGQQHHLASRPFQVLLHLIENRDRFVARAELLERFWSGKDVYDDTLTKCVGAIRKALDERQGSPQFIETRYAEGYRYIGPFADFASSGILIEAEQRRDVRIVIEEEEVQQTEPAQFPSPSLHAIAAPSRLLSVKTSPRVIALALALVVIVLSAGAFIVYRNRARSTVNAATSAPEPLRSIAVMPLRNLTGDPANEYFSDGITESLITALSNIKGLKVISRNSVFKFRDKDADPHEVGQRLGVEALLEGSVSQSGGKVRVESRLVSVRDGSVLWANESYNSALGNFLDTQDEITHGVVAGLRLQLGATDTQQLAKHYTENGAAYRAYLKGRYLWNQRTPDAMHKAVEQFEQAIRLDQNFALAYAGLAETYAVMEINSFVAPRTAAPKGKEFAQKALALDGSLAGAEAALGLLASLSDWNWAEGDRHFQKALALNPGYATAHSWYANSLLAQGKFAQAESELKRALDLDPLSVGISSGLAEVYYYERQYDRCLAQAGEIRELHPAYELYLGRCHWQQGRYTEAITEFQKDGWSEADLSVARALAAGRPTEARRFIAAVAKGQRGTNNPYSIAGQYAAAGDKESAFAWLEKAYAAHQADLVSIKIEPAFDPIRCDPRFADLLRRLGLPQ
jgi:TolB-like protein/DNA-binding winged helix-turn-helix (wHTH) protein/Flp pilus assembly protein TadD